MIGETLFEIIFWFFFDTLWEKLFRPFFYYTGIAFRHFLNLFRKTKPDPHKRKYNTFIGVLIWLTGVVTFFVVRNN
jgi:hypothetical protein